MALIQCPECGKDVSNTAVTCPNCGFKIQSHIRKTENEAKKLQQNKIRYRKQLQALKNETFWSKPKNIILATIMLFACIIAISYTARHVSDYNRTKYRITYNSEQEMLQDICGTWRLYHRRWSQFSDSYIIFDESYSETDIYYDDNNHIEDQSTNKILLSPDSATIHYIKEDGSISSYFDYDIVKYNGTKYLRTNTDKANPDDWLVYKKISSSTDVEDIR